MTSPAPSRPPDRDWLAALCGPHHDLVWEDATEDTRADLDSPAILFADQNKAFERVSYPWLAAVLRGWGFDPWVLRSFLALNVGRSVVPARPGRTRSARRLACSVGMGGTVSPLAWGIAYDPIIVCVHRVSGCDAPTYVDDLAALIRTALQARLASHALVFASWCAGLVVSAHDCRRLRVWDWSGEDRRLASTLPVTVRPRTDGSVELTGLPPRLMASAFSRGRSRNERRLECSTLPCRCSLKTALVPACQHSDWQAVMDSTVFTRHAVTHQWPYLGVCLASLLLVDPAAYALDAAASSPPPGSPAPSQLDCDPPHGISSTLPGRPSAGWSNEAALAMATTTWGKASGKLTDRILTTQHQHLSFGRRSSTWNIYMISLLPYPAHCSPPPPSVTTQLRGAMATVLGLRAQWCPETLLTGLGPKWHLKGGPNCLLLGHGRACMGQAGGLGTSADQERLARGLVPSGFVAGG